MEEVGAEETGVAEEIGDAEIGAEETGDVETVADGIVMEVAEDLARTDVTEDVIEIATEDAAGVAAGATVGAVMAVGAEETGVAVGNMPSNEYYSI